MQDHKPQWSFLKLQTKERMTMMIILLTSFIFLTMTVVIVAISYSKYKNAFYEYSNKTCLDTNAAAAYIIDGDLVEHFVETLEPDEEYERFCAKLDEFMSKIDARYFYIMADTGVPGHYTYIYDATHAEDYPDEQYALGTHEDKGKHEGADEVLSTGLGFEQALYYYEDEYGELYFAYAPIFNSQNEVVAFVGTDVDISVLREGLASYRSDIILTIIIAFLLFIGTYFFIVRRILSKPMDDITKQAQDLSVSLHVLENIMNGMDAYLYVSDIETDEILFINNKMREHFNLGQDVMGQICWKVLQSGFTEKCDFCPGYELVKDPGKTVVWEEHNTVTNRFYRNVDRVIEWTDGKKVHLQHSTDITELKQSAEFLKKRLQQQELMSTISQSFITEDDMDSFIGNALRMIGEFMAISRVRLGEYRSAEGMLEYNYQWRHCGCTLERTGDDRIHFDEESSIYRSLVLEGQKIIAFDDSEEIDEILYDISSDIRAMMYIPILANKKLWGVMEFDVCTPGYIWSDSDKHLANLVANMLSALINRQIVEDEKKAAQEQVARISSIINSASQYISYIDKNGNYNFVNPACYSITGYTQEELMRLGRAAIYEPETNSFITGVVIPTVFEQGKYNFEAIFIRKDGQRRTMSMCCFTIDSDKDGIGVIASDITEQKRMEAEILESKEQAEQASKAKGEFLSRMSHEMRTPMNAIIGMTNIAKGTSDPQRIEYCLSRIDNASKHLLGVINDILDMSKIEANKFELYQQEFDFENMLINVVNVINFRIEEKQQSLIVNLGNDVPLSIVGDELRLSQVVSNLLTNAVKFTPENGSIRLDVAKLSEQDGYCTLKIAVSDTGIGISEEQQARLFTSFEQADGSTSRKYGGTGLGLAISKRIVELMDGAIWIESTLGQGSSFIFTIRVKMGEAGKPYRIPSGISRDKLRILAVDDALEIREYFLHICESLELPCSVAAGGAEALEIVESCGELPYNIFFIDWRMPQMDGIELTRRIKEITNNNAIVFMISSADWDHIEREATAAGVDKFVTKPLFPSSIVNCINECIGVPQSSAPADSGAGSEAGLCFKGHTLLLAEDVDINREILAAILEDTQVAIDFAENGRCAVEMFTADPDRYSMILMDIQMPEMDGYKATRLIRAMELPQAKDIPIVAMTANVFREDIDNCLAAGMNDHIGKPVDEAALMRMLNSCLNGPFALSKKK